MCQLPKQLSCKLKICQLLKDQILFTVRDFCPFFKFSLTCFVSICKLPIFLMLPLSALNSIVLNYVVTCQKQLWRNLALVNLEKVKFFTRNVIPKFFELTFLTLEAGQQVAQLLDQFQRQNPTILVAQFKKSCTVIITKKHCQMLRSL